MRLPPNAHAYHRITAQLDLVCAGWTVVSRNVCNLIHFFLPQVNYFGKLATDTVPAVRTAFLDMVGTLMLTLDERNEHEARLLPYVLSSLSDEAASIQETAIGATWPHSSLHCHSCCARRARCQRRAPSTNLNSPCPA